MRSRDPRYAAGMKWLLLAIALAACGRSSAPQGAGSAISTKPHAFPGFTLELPAGREEPGGDEAVGSFGVSSAAKPQFVVSIKWQTAAITPTTFDQWEAGVTAQLGPAAKFQRVQHAGHDSVDVDIDDEFMTWTPLACGTRMITVQTTAYDRALRSLHDHMVASLACH